MDNFHKSENKMFTRNELMQSPSYRCGLNRQQELEHRNLAASFCHDLWLKLNLLVKFIV